MIAPRELRSLCARAPSQAHEHSRTGAAQARPTRAERGVLSPPRAHMDGSGDLVRSLLHDQNLVDGAIIDAADGQGLTALHVALLAGNDDADGCDDGTSELTVEVHQGQPVLIRVGGRLDARGEGTLSVTCTPSFGACCLDTQEVCMDVSSLVCLMTIAEV